MVCKNYTMKNNHNKHHIWSPKYEYSKRDERNFRNLGAFVVKVDMEAHKTLHATIDHPPKPTKREISECTHYLTTVRREMKHDQFWGVEAAIRYFMMQDLEAIELYGVEHSDHDRYVATRNNLAAQIGALTVVKHEIVQCPTEQVREHGIIT